MAIPQVRSVTSGVQLAYLQAVDNKDGSITKLGEKCSVCSFLVGFEWCSV